MKQSLNLLKRVVSNYNEFCHFAERLEWIDIKEEHENWFRTYPLGIFIDTFEFPKGYLKNNIVSAYVRAIFSSIAFFEEWDKNFWNIPQLERKEILTKGQALYLPYAVVKELRFIKRDWKYIVKEIEYFSSRNKISALKQKKYIDKFENAKAIEIGGSYSDDFIYMAIKKNLMLIVSCGVWD
ncbi:hypothetical protein [Clostridium sp. MD294]|uniref:hypothetical protein n=1 Tax=Clostridium sp. MD294 TaxID=97138 RepID=UPI0002CB2698|nr:hypothetical protein [Clostridium sp. MD294]NDO47382.1 hypothetical protein [Clostridium sp. MD294]USF29548.1 hypothetical protein C820_000948 [Clostridium sp. MD294]